eukprot:7579517-Ditylum_brightwellii.AAC.1
MSTGQLHPALTHKFKLRMFKSALPEITPSQALTLLEVFVDNFIAATNDIARENLQQLSQAMMHGIHAIFSPPEASGHSGHNPISESKIDKGEVSCYMVYAVMYVPTHSSG